MNAAAPLHYEQCGMVLRSEVVLDLPPAESGRWDVDVRWGGEVVSCDEPPPGDIIAEFVSGGTSWYSVGETESGYVLRFRECGEFVISPDLSEVVVHPRRDGRRELLPVLMAGTTSALLLALRGETVLHASAVAVDGAALAFVGQSGRGKSTVAALMCLGGAELVSDDLVTVDPGPPVTCRGAGAPLRLRAAAAHLAAARPDRPSHTTVDQRLAFAAEPARAGSLPLAAIVVPSPSRTATALSLRRLSASDAVFTMVGYPRVHGWRSRDVLTRDFSTLSRVAGDVPVYDAIIPWGPPFDPEVARALSSLAHGALDPVPRSTGDVVT